MDDAHTLVVGIANYQHVSRLPEIVLNDARALHDVLVKPTQGGYLIQNVQLLLDNEATQSALRRALADLSRRTTGESTVFIYMSSHGARVENGPTSGEYLLPVDAYASSDRLAESSISGAEFSNALRAYRRVRLLSCSTVVTPAESVSRKTPPRQP